LADTYLALILLKSNHMKLFLLSSCLFQILASDFHDYHAGVPVIDYTELNSENNAEELAKFKDALERVGFFVLTNHQIPKDIMDKTWDTTRRFFDTDVENKNTVEMTDEYMYGYTAAEILSRSEFDESDTFRPDDKESLNVMIGARNSSHASARFPPQPADMESIYVAYYRQLEIIVANLLSRVAQVLDMPADFFENKIDDHMSVIRVVNYPHQSSSPPEGVLRCSPHTDYGTFTILRQDNVGGLQVEREENSDDWIDVKTRFYDFSVNLGDLLRRWTNNRYRSTRHRVANANNPNAKSNRRQSIVFFHNLNGEALVETIPSCLIEGKSSYDPILFNDYISMKHHATQLYDEEGKSNLDFAKTQAQLDKREL